MLRNTLSTMLPDCDNLLLQFLRDYYIARPICKLQHGKAITLNATSIYFCAFLILHIPVSHF